MNTLVCTGHALSSVRLRTLDPCAADLVPRSNSDLVMRSLFLLMWW